MLSPGAYLIVARKIFTCAGGNIFMPEPRLVLVDRKDGGNLVVSPLRDVWERCELEPVELSLWSYLVAATGKAMLDVLPQLAGGCINYWEAGNWALNEEAEPRGHKCAKNHRRVHLHLFGRSPVASSPSWRWGEAPFFPNFADRFEWARKHQGLTGEESLNVVRRAEQILRDGYHFTPSQLGYWFKCVECEYPAATNDSATKDVCAECLAAQ